jgi:hypothetical protein
MLSGIISESEYKAKLEEKDHMDENGSYKFVIIKTPGGKYGIAKVSKHDNRFGKYSKHFRTKEEAEEWVEKQNSEKESLNENFVGTGMVGNPFEREKTDYELAFEHFTKTPNPLNEEAKLEENAASNLELKSLAKQLYMGFKKLGATTKLQTTKMTVGSKGAFTDNNVNIFVDNDTIQVDINSKGIGVPKAEELKNNIKKSFPKVILTPQQGGSDWEGNKIISFALTPGNEMSESLNEHYVGGGIVGVGAITQIPPREKNDYELAFEHFLGGRYETKFENREQDDSIEQRAEIESEARENSKEGYVQHVNLNQKTGQYYISDWYDSDETVASYQNGEML